jgi:purine-cytosine permease-like protein
VPALSIIVAGTALGWTNTAADYTRYLPRATRPGAIVFWTTLGAFVPLFALMAVGILLGATTPGLAASANPLADIAAALPAWFALPYLFTAVGGLIAGNVLASYSSGLNLLAMFVRVARYKTVVIDAVVSILGALYVILFAPDFLGAFTTFLLLLAAGLAPWAAIFLVDMALRRARYATAALSDTRGAYRYLGGANPAALMAWLVGVVLSLLLTSSPLVSGPLARGVFAGSSLGFLAGALAAGLLYALLGPIALRRWAAGP